jgi:hypothetical protein
MKPRQATRVDRLNAFTVAGPRIGSQPRQP